MSTHGKPTSAIAASRSPGDDTSNDRGTGRPSVAATSSVRSLLSATAVASGEPSAGAVSFPNASRFKCSISTLESLLGIVTSAG